RRRSGGNVPRFHINRQIVMPWSDSDRLDCDPNRMTRTIAMAKPAVVLVGADKGGVGKTTVSRALLDYFIAHNVATRAFDTEAPKGTLQRFHSDVSQVVDITSAADQMKIFDTLTGADAQVTVIDVRAGLLSTTL